MNKLIASCLAVAALPAIGGCNRQSSLEADIAAGCPEIPRLNVETASQDAVRQLRAGSKKLLGVHGYALKIPGVLVFEAVKQKFEISAIPGTSDAFGNAPCRKLNEQASDYARRYNGTVLEGLRRLRSAR